MEYGELMEENAKLKHYLRTTGKLYLMLGLMDDFNKLKEENARLRRALEKITELHNEDGSIMQRYAYEALESGK